MKHEDCPECQVGLKQALAAHIGWTCLEHGTDYIDVQQMVEALIDLRQQLAKAIAERDEFRAALRQAELERDTILRGGVRYSAPDFLGDR